MAVHKERDDLWWLGKGWEDYLYWQANDPSMVEKINDLIENIRREPWAGKGKPEPLRNNWAGWWSRRITQEHRLIYQLIDMPLPRKGQAKPEMITIIRIAQCRFHY